MKKLKPNREPLKADYQGATPREVAEAVLRYRGPGKPVRQIRKKTEDAPFPSRPTTSEEASRPVDAGISKGGGVRR